ncbi:MAG: hypothetical protein ACM30E_04270, partial [Nitrososphaerales archaeon]
MRDVSGITGAGPIWHDFMAAVSAGRPRLQFAVPDGMVQQEVCADSGLLPAQASPQGDVSRVEVVPCPARRFEWFIEGTEPQEVDRQHLRVMIDNQTGEVAAGGSSDVHPEVVWQLGPEFQAWARDNKIRQVLVSASDETGELASLPGAGSAPLRLVSPDPGRSFQIDPGLPAGAQQLPVTALPGFAAAQVTLTVDGVAFAIVGGPEYTAWWPLKEGRHVFGAWATREDGSRVESPEVTVVVDRNQ